MTETTVQTGMPFDMLPKLPELLDGTYYVCIQACESGLHGYDQLFGVEAVTAIRAEAQRTMARLLSYETSYAACFMVDPHGAAILVQEEQRLSAQLWSVVNLCDQRATGDLSAGLCEAVRQYQKTGGSMRILIEVGRYERSLSSV